MAHKQASYESRYVILIAVGDLFLIVFEGYCCFYRFLQNIPQNRRLQCHSIVMGRQSVHSLQEEKQTKLQHISV